MELPIYQVDAFASRLFGGNPAAVVMLPEWLPDETLQAIAQENNLAETAFVVSHSEAFELRWFTPAVEVDLCGHATLAAAYVLLSHGYTLQSQVSFRYQGGTLTVTREGDLLAMDFPSRPATAVACETSLTQALRATPQEVHRSRDLLVVFEKQAEVEALQPDIALIAKLDAFAVMTTAPGRACDFVYRFFAPRVGIPEDPATGSAQCTLVPYWSERLGKTRLHAFQLSRRVGEFFCENRGDRVKIAGHAVEYLSGRIVV